MVLPHPLSLAKAAAEILVFRKEINNSLEQCRNCRNIIEIIEINLA